MTWQGGKRGREVGPSSPFARWTPLAAHGDDAATGLQSLSESLAAFPTPVRLHVRLLSGSGTDETIEHWEVHGGGPETVARQAEPQDADVVVVMRPETWTEIAQGRLAPYEALYTGRLRIGGDFEAAKAITQYLSDPAAPYVAPC